jgi:hypothetical protein
MAEAVAALGLAASIVQFVELSAKLVRRLSEFQDHVDQLPGTLQEIKQIVPLLDDALTRTKRDAASGNASKRSQEALEQVVRHCHGQLEKLNKKLDKIIPKAGDSSITKRLKALASIREEKAIQGIMASLHKQIGVLAYHHVAPQTSAREPGHAPLFMVPFERDRKFVIRGGIIDTIQERLAVQRRIALVGIGGVGYVPFHP